MSLSILLIAVVGVVAIVAVFAAFVVFSSRRTPKALPRGRPSLPAPPSSTLAPLPDGAQILHVNTKKYVPRGRHIVLKPDINVDTVKAYFEAQAPGVSSAEEDGAVVTIWEIAQVTVTLRRDDEGWLWVLSFDGDNITDLKEAAARELGWREGIEIAPRLKSDQRQEVMTGLKALGHYEPDNFALTFSALLSHNDARIAELAKAEDRRIQMHRARKARARKKKR